MGQIVYIGKQGADYFIQLGVSKGIIHEFHPVEIYNIGKRCRVHLFGLFSSSWIFCLNPKYAGQ